MVESEAIQVIVNKQKEAASLVKEAASEINIISINAAIESAHAASGIRLMMEKVLDSQMISICRVIARLVDRGGLSMDSTDIIDFAKWVGVEAIFITDADGVTVGSNTPEAYGWRFPEDPNAQASAFRILIKQKDGVVTQPIQARDLDNAKYKFVGVSRTDQPGIVQIGYRAESITSYQNEVGAVFGILAEAINALGTKVTSIGKQMMEITLDIEKNLK